MRSNQKRGVLVIGAGSDEADESSEGEPSFSVSERRLAVAVLCSDLAHDIAPTLAFLRDLVRFGQMNEADRSIGTDEISRLQTLIASLRRTRRAEHPLTPVDLFSLVARAAERAKEELREGARIELEVEPGVSVFANERSLEITLVALLRNALAQKGREGITVRSSRAGDLLRVEIEDAGSGLPSSVADQPWIPLAMLGPDGRGLGLAMACRVARDHGWEMSYCRRDNRTVFCLEIGSR